MTTILAFDTSGPYCAVALMRDGQCLSCAAEDMTRGQAERLQPFIEAQMHRADVTYADLDRIGVGIGPGNFTGIRISVAFARGLALGRGIPAIGVSLFDVVHQSDPQAQAAIRAPRDHAYVARQGEIPVHIPLSDAPGAVTFPPAPAQIAEAIARISATRTTTDRPAPLYIKPADAAPPRDTAPRIVP